MFYLSLVDGTTLYLVYIKRRGWRRYPISSRRAWRTRAVSRSLCFVCFVSFLICCDGLSGFVVIVQCPFYGSYSEADPVRIAEEGVEQFRHDKYEVRTAAPAVFDKNILRTSAASPTNFGSILISVSCVVGTCNVLCG